MLASAAGLAVLPLIVSPLRNLSWTSASALVAVMLIWEFLLRLPLSPSPSQCHSRCVGAWPAGDRWNSGDCSRLGDTVLEWVWLPSWSVFERRAHLPKCSSLAIRLCMDSVSRILSHHLRRSREKLSLCKIPTLFQPHLQRCRLRAVPTMVAAHHSGKKVPLSSRSVRPVSQLVVELQPSRLPLLRRFLFACNPHVCIDHCRSRNAPRPRPSVCQCRPLNCILCLRIAVDCQQRIASREIL